MKKTFFGGVHPDDAKALSRDAKLTSFLPRGEMVFPLSQHIGKPARAVVKKGDSVLAGQVIGEADGFVSANVICSCSGKVKAVEKRRSISGALLECVVVENDGQFTKAEGFGERRDPAKLSKEEILAAVKAAGIVGLGGAGFPTHVKLAPKNPQDIRYIIANGAECEPYLTGNDHLMREKAGDIVEGLQILVGLFPGAKGVICIEENKPEAIAAMEAAAAGKKDIEVLPLHTKYPQGGERSLIQAVAGVDFPVKSLPADVGCIVQNVGTVYAVQRAVCFGEPLFTHVLTVTGEGVERPMNLIVPDGTSVAEIIEYAGGFRGGKEPKKVLAGGPMMGFAMSSIDVPVVKTTNGITILASDPVEKAQLQMTACLRCGRCTTVCPQGLMPQMMAEAWEAGNEERFEVKLYGLDCIACGSCAYICPAKRPLTQIFKQAKAEIMAKKRAQAAGGKK